MAAELLGMTVHWLRVLWLHRHDGSTPAEAAVHRMKVREMLARLREDRERWPGVVPLLQRISAPDGAGVDRRHLWGPGGPDPASCACALCRADAAPSTLHRTVAAMGRELMRRRLAGLPTDTAAQREAMTQAASETRVGGAS